MCGDRGLADVILNAGAFVPGGLAAALATGAWWAGGVLGGVLTVLVETAQVVIPGRHPALGDVVFNSLGAALGGALVFAGGRRGGVRAVVAAALPPAAVAATAWLLAPVLTPGPYHALWTPDFVGPPAYPGRVEGATVAGEATAHRGRVPPEAVRAFVLGDAPVRLEAVAGPAFAPPSVVLSLRDGADREIVGVLAMGNDLMIGPRTRGGLLRLDRPHLLLRAALRAREGEVWSLAVPPRGSGWVTCATVSGASRCGRDFTVAEAWRFLYEPGPALPDRGYTLVGLAWLAALFAGVGWAPRTRRGSLVGFAVALGAAQALAALLGLPVLGVPAMVAAAAGAATGRGARRLVGAPRRPREAGVAGDEPGGLSAAPPGASSLSAR